MAIERTAPPTSLGIRHIALRVRNLEAAERFYSSVLGYRVEWRPDSDNVYLSLAGDNLALHRDASAAEGHSSLDHFGIVVRRSEDVDGWAAHLEAHGIALEKRPKTHRDGARSLYVRDPEGTLLQILYHPPISR